MIAALALLLAAAPDRGPVISNAEALRRAMPLLGATAAVVKVSAGFSGELLVSTISNHGQMAFTVGPEGSSQKTPKTDPIWRWASVTKQVVAVAVMQQVEDGRLSLDAPLASVMPDIRVANAGRITVRQLLQHTSGLPNPDDGPKTADGTGLLQYERRSPKPAPGLSPICLGPAKAEPGVRFDYNNCDYEVLGQVLEKVSGQPLAKLLEQRIYKPAGMTRVRLLVPGGDAGRPGYDAAGKPDSSIDPGRFGAAAGLAGTASELAAFDRALLDGRLLKPASRAEMWKGDPKFGYAALGQWSYTVPLKGCAAPVALVERRGQVGSVEVRNVIAPDKGIILIAFADRPTDFGEPRQGKGVTYDLLSAALCPAN